MIEKFYLLVYVISLLIIGITTLITGETYGEAKNVNLSFAEILLLLIIYLLTYIFFYMFYKKTKNRIPRIKKFFIFDTNKEKMHLFYFVTLIISLCGTVFFEIGKDLGKVSTSFSFLFNLLKVHEFLPIYYTVARDEKKRLYWINIFLYCFLRTIQGWTSWILAIGSLELYFRFKKKGAIRRIFLTFGAWKVALLGILSGAGIFYFVRPLRELIRYGGRYSWYRLSLKDTLITLIERFSNFPVYTAAWQNSKIMRYLYLSQNVSLSEFRSLFFPILPSFLMANKNFRTLSNIVGWSMWNTLTEDTGTGYGFVMYWYTLFRCDSMDFFVCLIASILLFFVTGSILYGFDNKSHDMNFVYFMFLIKIANGGSIQQLYGYGYIAAIYLIFFMYLFGVIKIKRIRS